MFMATNDLPVDGDALAAFSVEAVGLLQTTCIPFLVGGTFAYSRYTAIDRQTKDLDVFVRAQDIGATLRLFENAGYTADVTYPHWLAKVSRHAYVMDIVFSPATALRRSTTSGSRMPLRAKCSARASAVETWSDGRRAIGSG
jgi:hypothetical protein